MEFSVKASRERNIRWPRIVLDEMPDRKIRRWTDEEIIKRPKEMHQLGVPMTGKGVGAVDSTLLAASVNHLGLSGKRPRWLEWRRKKAGPGMRRRSSPR
jgi:hypothetical protein